MAALIQSLSTNPSRLVALRPSALQQLPERVPQHGCSYTLRVAAWELQGGRILVLRCQHAITWACVSAFKVTVGLTSGIAYTQAIGVVSQPRDFAESLSLQTPYAHLVCLTEPVPKPSTLVNPSHSVLKLHYVQADLEHEGTSTAQRA